jgi:branched-chain amino acid transport system substrate-binding protein
MTILPVTNPSGGITEPANVAAVNVAEKWINSHGGIGGRTLHVIICDDQGDANVSESCARQAAADHVAAVVGSLPDLGNGAQNIKILEAEKIPNLGETAPDAEVLASPDDYATVGGPAALIGGTGLLAGKYCTGGVGVVVVQTGEQAYFVSSIEAGLATFGKKPKVVVSLPQGATDYSAQVAQVTSGTQCIVAVASTPQMQVFYAEMQQAGDHQKIIGVAGNTLNAQLATQFPQLTNGGLISAYFPALSSPLWKDYNQAIAKYSDATKYDFDTSGAEDDWISYLIFKQLVADLPQVTAATVTGILNKASSVSTGGLTPTLNFAQPYNLPTVGRTANASITYQAVQNGKIVPFNNSAFVSVVPIYTKAK